MKRIVSAVALTLAAASVRPGDLPVPRDLDHRAESARRHEPDHRAAALRDHREADKQPAPVINKPGGTAAVGTAYVANQKPDGYNILVTTPNLYLVVEKNKAQNIESPYRLEQIQPIALTSADPLVLRRADGSAL